MGVLKNKINIIFRNYEIWQQLFGNQDKAVSCLLWCAAQIPLQDWRIYSPQLLGVLLADSRELERSALRSHPLNAQCGSIKARPPDAMQDSEGSSGCPTGSMEALLQLPDSPASSSARNLHPVLPSPHLPRYGSREPSPINALHANLRVCFSSNPTCNRQSDNQTIKIHFLHGC